MRDTPVTSEESWLRGCQSPLDDHFRNTRPYQAGGFFPSMIILGSVSACVCTILHLVCLMVCYSDSQSLTGPGH